MRVLYQPGWRRRRSLVGGRRTTDGHAGRIQGVLQRRWGLRALRYGVRPDDGGGSAVKQGRGAGGRFRRGYFMSLWMDSRRGEVKSFRRSTRCTAVNCMAGQTTSTLWDVDGANHLRKTEIKNERWLFCVMYAPTVRLVGSGERAKI